MAVIESVNVGRVLHSPWAPSGGSAIDKRPVAGPVAAHALGLDGDAQANRAVHGGVDQAVYAYAREDLDAWAAQLARELSAGVFGENLTTVGVDVTGAVIGERWQVGGAELEVSAPRIPCSVFASFLGETAWVRRFTDAGRPGAYLRVVVDGVIEAGDAVVLLSRPEHGVTVGDTFRALTVDRALLPTLLEVPQLPAGVHEEARTYLAGRRPAGT